MVVREGARIGAVAWRRFGVFAVVFAFLACLSARGVLTPNEDDVLAVAKQAVVPDWLPADWYLSLPSGYRVAFNFTFGWLLAVLPFPTAAMVGRFVTFALFAGACQSLVRTLRLTSACACAGILVFVSHQSIVAGEWIVGGFEAKAVAYPLVLFGLSAALRRRFVVASALLGLATTFHVLVGAYAAICVCLAIAVVDRASVGRCELMRAVATYLVASAAGVVAALHELGAPAALNERAAWVMVHFRHPHHLLPSYWLAHGSLLRISATFLACLAGLAVAARAWPTREGRGFAVFAVSTAAFFAIGLLAAAAGSDRALKFFLFRLPDTAVPFGCTLLGGGALALAAERWVTLRFREPVHVGLLALAWAVAHSPPRHRPSPRERAYEEATTWIRANTPRDSVFLIDPTIEDFYARGERAQFVSFKHVPLGEPTAIVEWYRRLEALREPGTGRPRNRQDVARAYGRLSARTILRLSREEGITYVLVRARTDPFAEGGPNMCSSASECLEPVFGNDEFVVYRSN
jgi:hypothetical protein